MGEFPIGGKGVDESADFLFDHRRFVAVEYIDFMADQNSRFWKHVLLSLSTARRSEAAAAAHEELKHV
jgi:hypothetical protein